MCSLFLPFLARILKCVSFSFLSLQECVTSPPCYAASGSAPDYGSICIINKSASQANHQSSGRAKRKKWTIFSNKTSSSSQSWLNELMFKWTTVLGNLWSFSMTSLFLSNLLAIYDIKDLWPSRSILVLFLMHCHTAVKKTQVAWKFFFWTAALLLLYLLPRIVFDRRPFR